MFKRIVVMLAVAGIMVAGCAEKDGFETTDSGLQYKFISKGTSGMKPQEGEVVTLNLSMVSQGDSILMQGSNMPIQKVEQMWSVKGGIEEAFSMLAQGDSLIAKVKAGDLYQRTWQMPVPPNLDPEELIICVIGLEGIYDPQDFQKQQALARVGEVEAMRQLTLNEKKEQMDTDLAIIDAYLKKNKIAAETTESGMRYVILEEGSGPRPEVGDNVSVHYTGNVLDGEYFDCSLEEKAKEIGLYDEQRPYGPIEFTLGTGGVIHGWDEGIALLNEGSKARLYIPSPMAYGERQRSEVIVANAILEFEVELVSIQ